MSLLSFLPALRMLVRLSLHQLTSALRALYPLHIQSEDSSSSSRQQSRQQTADSRQQTADSRQQTADSRQQTADSRQQTADSRAGSRSFGQVTILILTHC
jgi:hypothetical protein